MLGPTLIKRATAWLLEHEPQVEAFSTLSPIPNFAAWLQLQVRTPDATGVRCPYPHLPWWRGQFALREREGSAVRPLVPPGSSQLEEAPWLDGTADGGSKARLSRADHALQSALCLPRWEEREDVAPMVRPVLLRLCALYLQGEKNHGRSLCPVANFHLGNGAVRRCCCGDTLPADCPSDTPLVAAGVAPHQLDGQPVSGGEWR